MNPSADLVEFLRWWEGLPGGKPALDAYADSAGKLTIGYGHTGNDVFLGQTIDAATAEALLSADIESRAEPVDMAARIPLEQYQFDALVSFAFNLGLGALQGSTLLRYVNGAQFTRAALEFTKWDHAGGVEVAGLLKRRTAEQHMFQNLPGGYDARP